MAAECFELAQTEQSDRLDVTFYSVRRRARLAIPPGSGQTLGALAVPVRTSTPARENLTKDGGIPCIKLRNVRGSFLDITDCDYIPNGLKSSYTAARKYDIIVTATGEGTAGRADIFIESGSYIVTGENILLRPKRDRVNPFYLLAMLRTDVVSAQLTHYVRGATGQTHLYWTDIRDIVIPDASQSVQANFQSSFLQAWAKHREAETILSTAESKANQIVGLSATSV